MKKLVLSFLLLFTISSLFAQEYTLEGNEVKTPYTVLFKTGKAILDPESDSAIGVIKRYLDAKKYITLMRVECHTDNSGNAKDNQQLSEQRAMSVCRRLVLLGVDCKRLSPVGFGGSKPVADNSTPDGPGLNHRVCFINAGLMGRMIGGMPADGGGKVAGNPCL